MRGCFRSWSRRRGRIRVRGRGRREAIVDLNVSRLNYIMCLHHNLQVLYTPLFRLVVTVISTQGLQLVSIHRGLDTVETCLLGRMIRVGSGGDNNLDFLVEFQVCHRVLDLILLVLQTFQVLNLAVLSDNPQGVQEMEHIQILNTFKVLITSRE